MLRNKSDCSFSFLELKYYIFIWTPLSRILYNILRAKLINLSSVFADRFICLNRSLNIHYTGSGRVLNSSVTSYGELWRSLLQQSYPLALIGFEGHVWTIIIPWDNTTELSHIHVFKSGTCASKIFIIKNIPAISNHLWKRTKHIRGKCISEHLENPWLYAF